MTHARIEVDALSTALTATVAFAIRAGISNLPISLISVDQMAMHTRKLTALLSSAIGISSSHHLALTSKKLCTKMTKTQPGSELVTIELVILFLRITSDMLR